MREKYIDEAVGLYFIFGKHSANSVDVSDGTKDVFINIPEITAHRIVQAQEEFREKLYKIMED